MRLLWILQCIVGAHCLPDCGAESEEGYTQQPDTGDSLFLSLANNTGMADSAAGFEAIDPEELSSMCAITVLTGEMADPEGGHPATIEDLSPVKGLLDGSSWVLESLASAVNAEIGKVSYQSMIADTVLDIKQHNQLSNNIMAEILQSLHSDTTSESHVTKFKEKVSKMEAMLQAIEHLATQVEQMSDTLSTELSQHLDKSRKMESTLHQRPN
uniref:uncharacterized protein n=1 Tax=Pristiophorus japonicus TaxID=55135 RepID=UPI00398E8748